MSKNHSSEEVTAKLDLNTIAGVSPKPKRSSRKEPKKMQDTQEVDLKAFEEKTEKLDIKEAKEPEAEKTEEKPKKKRAPRKPKAEAESKEEAKEEKEDKVEEAIEAKEEVAEVKEKPKRKRAPRKPKKEVAQEEGFETAELVEMFPEEKAIKSNDPSPSQVSLRQDVSVTSAAMHKTMESMTKQWGTVKEVSDSISENFDRVGKHLQEVSSAYTEAMKQLTELQSKQQIQRPSTLTKIAVGFSSVAVVLSLLSLVFSQNVRKQVIDRTSVKSDMTSKGVIAQLPKFAKEEAPAETPARQSVPESSATVKKIVGDPAATTPKKVTAPKKRVRNNNIRRNR